MAGGHLLHDPQQLITCTKKFYPIKNFTIFVYLKFPNPLAFFDYVV